MIAGKNLFNYTNLSSHNDYKKNNKIIFEYFKDKYGKRKYKPDLGLKNLDETRNYPLEK